MSLHLAYRWFLGYDFDVSTPDHSVLSKARIRLGSEVFDVNAEYDPIIGIVEEV